MHKQFTGYAEDVKQDLEAFYADFILPEYSITKELNWERHVKTDPDNFLHVFLVGDVKYALAFDDFPSGFSVHRDSSLKSMKLPNGDEVLNINSPFDKYTENITGAFMLFQVLDVEAFDNLLNYLEITYENLQKKWHSESRDTVVITRDVLQLAETASFNHDSSALFALKNLVETFNRLEVEDNDIDTNLLREYVEILLDAEFGYEVYTPKDKTRLQNEIYQSIAKETQDTLKLRKYHAAVLDRTVKLVTAMYARVSNDKTEGIAITIIVDEDGVKYPADHFINDELKKYFAENTYIVKSNIADNMPETLQDYRLVDGSVYVKDIFPQELNFISF